MCLRSHVPMGFQVGSEDLLNIAVTLKFQLYKHKDLLRGIITPSQKKAVAAFVQAPGDYFDAEPTFKQSYAPQSGAIFGILKQMKEYAGQLRSESRCVRKHRRVVTVLRGSVGESLDAL